ncbi:uncharacterized protein [Oryza sativa Japonica Group]|nr:uncharacterized protein LOC107276894 [Oryza sativa Japonica Group]KAF2945472.1 hypothetical protein DAI22_02g218900 [Oryza sativa Japonica Group]
MAFSGGGRQQGDGPSDGDDGVPRSLIGGRPRPILEQIKLNATQMHNLRMQVEYLVAVTKTRQRANGSEGTNSPAVGTPGMSLAAAAEVAVAAVLAAAAARAASAAADNANEAEGSGGNKQEAAVTTAPTSPEN